MPPVKLIGLGKVSRTSSFLISPRSHAGHVAALVDVHQHERAGFELRIGAIGNHRFALAAHDRPGLVALQPGGASSALRR